MKDITVRDATSKDLKTLLEFEQGLIEVERPIDEDLKEGFITYYDIDSLISAPDTRLVVAEYSDRIIGSGYSQIKKADPHMKYEYYSYIGFMYVIPEYRGARVGHKILGSLLEWSKKRKIFNVKLEVYTNNHSAIKAYKKAGFYERATEMRFDINEV